MKGKKHQKEKQLTHKGKKTHARRLTLTKECHSVWFNTHFTTDRPQTFDNICLADIYTLHKYTTLTHAYFSLLIFSITCLLPFSLICSRYSSWIANALDILSPFMCVCFCHSKSILSIWCSLWLEVFFFLFLSFFVHLKKNRYDQRFFICLFHAVQSRKSVQ